MGDLLGSARVAPLIFIFSKEKVYSDNKISFGELTFAARKIEKNTRNEKKDQPKRAYERQDMGLLKRVEGKTTHYRELLRKM